MAKREKTPKDIASYLEEARELRRLFPKLTANAAGKKIAEKHPEVKGDLAQAIRKELKREGHAAVATSETAPPTPAAPVAPSVSPQKAIVRSRVRYKSAAQRAQEAYERTLGFRLEQLTRDIERAKLYRHIFEQDQRQFEALRQDPAMREFLRLIFEDDD